MDNVPFAFIDSVAHSLSSDSASTLADIPIGHWPYVGLTHRSQRRDFISDLIWIIDQTDRTEYFDKQIATFTRSPKYSRFTEVNLIGLFGRVPRYLARIKQLEPLLKRNLCQNTELNVHRAFSCESEELSFLWRLPVKRLRIEDMIPHMRSVKYEILQWHIENNPFLEELRFYYATYNVLKMIIEAWKSGQSGLEKVSCTLENKDDWKRLEQLGCGTVEETRDFHCSILTCRESGRSLRIEFDNLSKLF